MRRIENSLDVVPPVAILASRDVAFREGKIVENAFRIRPLPEQIVVLEEMIVAESRVRDDQRLHGHAVLFEQIGNARIGIDDNFVRKAGVAATVELLFARKQLAERPMVVHKRHAKRRIGIEHLFGGDDLDLVGVDVEFEVDERNLLDGAINAIERGKIPFRFGEEQRCHQAGSDFLNSSRNTGKMSAGLAMRLVAKLGHCDAAAR